MEEETDLSSYDSYWRHRHVSGNRYRYDVFMSWIPRDSEVLDAGCGDGFFGGRLVRERNCRVTGMDISDEALERARGNGMTTVVGSLDDRLPFGDASFDIVVASESLEHIVHSERALRELVRVARQAVIVSIPNTGYWQDRMALVSGTFPKQWIREPWEHLRFWTVSDFQNMLRGLGFSATDMRAGSGRRWLRDIAPTWFARQVCFRIQKP